MKRTLPLLVAAMLLPVGLGTSPAAGPQNAPQTAQLPAPLKGAKVYQLPDETKPGEEPENPVIYRGMSYEDINFDRLLLNLSLSLKPVDREATIRKIFFQDFRVNGMPVHIETFEEEFKLSKKEIVDLPAPLKCSIVFSDLESVKPLQEIVNRDSIQITGQTYIEVKLNVLQKLALLTKRLVLPVKVDEEVPLQMFSGNPLLQMAAGKILETLADPTTEAAAALARQHLAKLAADRALASLGRDSLYLLNCEYALRDPKTGVAEKFSESGTGFLVTADGQMLTAKRVVQPWKFDPEIASLMKRHQLQLEEKSYRLAAWPVGARIVSANGQLDFQSASTTEQGNLRLVKTAPDRMEKRDFRDPDTGEQTTLRLHAAGEADVALLRLEGGNFRPLPLTEEAAELASGLKTALLGFPFGLSRAQAEPTPIFVQATMQGELISLKHALNPGEAGAPLVTEDGKVLGVCGSMKECIPIEAVRELIQ